MLFDIVGRRYLFFLISLLIIIPGVLALGVWGLKLGIDFTGGTLWEVIPKAGAAVNTDEVITTLRAANVEGVDLRSAAVVEAELRSGNLVTPTIQMRMPNINPVQKARLTDVLVREGIVAGQVTTSTINVNNEAIPPTPVISGTTTVGATATVSGTAAPPPVAPAVQLGVFDPGQEIQFETVGPVVGQEVTNNAVFAVLLASLGILLYLWFAFRRVVGAWRYGTAAVIALLHDALVVVGIFAILGELFNVEIDALFVTAMLTVIGFSVHDTIVVFDRIRENQLRRRFDTFDKVVNYSLLQTLARSITTSLTVVFTLFALYTFGGVTIRNFVLALLIGVISGTFSSIFNASLLLVAWENRDWRHGWWKAARSPESEPAAQAGG
jgi:preprotein translocase subunit SecF